MYEPIESSEYYTRKVMAEVNKNMTDSGSRLIYLISKIPNWESYLTAKQLEAVKSFIKNNIASEVDYELNLSSGTAYSRIFGSGKSKGALGKLEEVNDFLSSEGYFDRIKANDDKENINKKKIKKTVMTQKTKDQLVELFTLVSEVKDYRNHLTKLQNEKLDKFIELKNMKKCAEYFGITETTLRQSLFGRDYGSGILNKLKLIQQNETVNNWSDI